MDSLKGHFLVKIKNHDERLDKEDKKRTGRQIAWLIFQYFTIDQNEGAVLTEHMVHNLRLEKDNVPAFLNKRDRLLFEC